MVRQLVFYYFIFFPSLCSSFSGSTAIPVLYFKLAQGRFVYFFTRFLILCLFLCKIPLTAYSRVEITLERVEIPSGKYKIEGLLVIPPGSEKKYAVIFLGGSGNWEIVESCLKNPEDSYAALIRYYCEKDLLGKGFAFLYLNKRGFGKSTGKKLGSSSSDRADDAFAAFEFLSQRKDINVDRIGMAGHSQGGWIAQLAAARNPKVAFVLCFGGPAVGVYEQTIENSMNDYHCLGLTDKQTKKKIRKRKLEFFIGGKIGRVIGGDAREWTKIKNYTNEQTLKSLRVPTLFVFGENDRVVPPETNSQHLTAVFNGIIPDYIKIHVEPGVDHSFRVVPKPCLHWMESLKYPYSTNLKSIIQHWILSTKKAV